VGAVADEREPAIGVALGMVKTERVGCRSCGELRTAQESADALVDLRHQRSLRKVEPGLSLGLRHGPNDGRTRAGQHRQDGERAGGVEDLEGNIAVVEFMLDHADDRRLVILPARSADARLLADARAASVGSDEQRRAQHLAAFQRHCHALRLALDTDRAGRGKELDQRRLAPGVDQRAADVPVFQHVAERFVLSLAAVEMQRVRAETLADADFVYRTGLAR
jgi:hypothetical protein